MILTPRIYKENIQQLGLRQNKVDTVILRPISNYAVDSRIVHTEVVTSAIVNGTQHALPLNNDITATYFRCIRNEAPGFTAFSRNEYAKARIDCVIATGTTICTLSEPILNVPTATLRFVGNSSKIARGNSTYSSFPEYDLLSTQEWSAATWIAQNKTETSDTLTHDYTGDTFKFNPWVRNVVPIGPLGSNAPVPTANDVITDWAASGGILSHQGVLQNGWEEGGNISSSSFAQFTMYSPSDTSIGATNTLRMYDMYLTKNVRVKKLDDYNVEVSWQVPARLAYIAASQELNPATLKDVDNFAYLDNISEIHIDLSAVPYDTSTQDISLSLTRNAELSDNVLNEFPLEIDAGEAFTVDSYFNDPSYKWTEELAHAILTRYNSGKYVFKCDVPARWAVQNNVHAGSSLTLQLPSGEMVQKNNRDVTFIVQNISKSFDKNKFVYTLHLKER